MVESVIPPLLKFQYWHSFLPWMSSWERCLSINGDEEQVAWDIFDIFRDDQSTKEKMKFGCIVWGVCLSSIVLFYNTGVLSWRRKERRPQFDRFDQLSTAGSLLGLKWQRRFMIWLKVVEKVSLGFKGTNCENRTRICLRILLVEGVRRMNICTEIVGFSFKFVL